MEERTIVRRRTAARAALPAFLCACGLVGLLGVLAMAQPGAKRPDVAPASVLNGKAIASVQASFEDALPFKRLAVSLTARLRYDLFGEGYAGVIAGTDGWLFSSEEFDPEFASMDRGFAAAVSDARDALASRGMALVVVPVPSKARVESAKLGRRVPPERLDGRYGRMLGALASAGVPAVDLAAAFGSVSCAEALYLRTDTHWTPEGARLAAAAVADVVAALPVAPVSGGASYVSSRTGVSERDGDLLSFLPGRGASLRALPEPDEVGLYETSAVEGASGDAASTAGLFGDQSIPVAIVGTSYSAEPLWNFDGFLKEALSCDVLKLAAEGEGPFAPMERALAGTSLDDVSCRVVVWEIPERYVPLSAL